MCFRFAVDVHGSSPGRTVTSSLVMPWPEDSKLAFSRQSRMQEPRPAHPKRPAWFPGPRLWAVGVGTRRRWGSHSKAVWWLVWSFPVSSMEEEGKKKSSFETNPATNSTPGRIFTGSEPDVLLAVRAFSALDTRLLTKQGRVASAPCPFPGLLLHHRGGRGPPRRRST